MLPLYGSSVMVALPVGRDAKPKVVPPANHWPVQAAMRTMYSCCFGRRRSLGLGWPGMCSAAAVSRKRLYFDISRRLRQVTAAIAAHFRVHLDHLGAEGTFPHAFRSLKTF